MCRIGSIKSKVPVHPSKALHLMLPQQEGHDNSGFAMVMQDLYGIFSTYKDKPLLSMACTQKGNQMVEEYMDSHNFVQLAEWIPVPNKEPGLDIQAMPYYVFRNYDFPEHYNELSQKEKEDVLLNTRLALRKLLEDAGEGYVYSFWPDVLTLKEIGDLLISIFGRTMAVCLPRILWYSVVRTLIMILFAMQRIHSSCRVILFVLMARILSTPRIRSSRSLSIVAILVSSPTPSVSFTLCIMCFTS